MIVFPLADVTRQKNVFSPFINFSRLISIAVTAHAVIKLCANAFALAIWHLCSIVFHYLEHNICHGL